MEKSVLELKQELVDVAAQIKEDGSLNNQEALNPFDVFSLYMYVWAGEDYETLYAFYPEGSMELSVEEFVGQNRKEENIEPHREFMRKFNEVRDFILVVKENNATVEFTLEGEETLTFQLMKEGNVWHAMPTPLQ